MEPLCEDPCTTMVSVCQNFFNATNQTGLPTSCSGPTTDCYSPAFAGVVPANFTCPDPLIRNPNSSISNPNCVGECCVPCPQTHFFYPSGVVDSIDQVSNVVLAAPLFCFVNSLLLPPV